MNIDKENIKKNEERIKDLKEQIKNKKITIKEIANNKHKIKTPKKLFKQFGIRADDLTSYFRISETEAEKIIHSKVFTLDIINKISKIPLIGKNMLKAIDIKIK